MFYFFFATNMVLFVLRHCVFGGFSLQVRSSIRHSCLIVTTPKGSTTAATLAAAGGYAITAWGFALPVILYVQGTCDIAFLLHEVGHKPDVLKMARSQSVGVWLTGTAVHTIFNPLALPTWLGKLDSVLRVWFHARPGKAPVQIIADLDFEKRADAYSAAHVGPMVLHERICLLVAGLVNCQPAEVPAFLTAQAGSNAGADLMLQRLKALEAM